MITGRRPKPTHLKLVTGNPGKRALNKNEPRPARTMPSPPDFLSEDAKTEWKRVAPELHRLGLLTPLDRAAFAAYCQSYGRWQLAERAIARMDEPLQGLLARTLLWVANRAMADMVRYAAEFGMTPSSRSRLGTPAADTRNPFAEFTPQ